MSHPQFAPPVFPSIVQAEVILVAGNCPPFAGSGTTTLTYNPASGAWEGQGPGGGMQLSFDGASLTLSFPGYGPYTNSSPSGGPSPMFDMIFGFSLSAQFCGERVSDGATFVVWITSPGTPVPATPACGCDCDCGCKAGQAGQTGAGSDAVAPLLPSADTPTEFSAAPIRYATGEIHLDATDLVGGGFGAAWGHKRSFVSRMYADADVGQGYNWQVAEWPYLLPETDTSGTLRILALMGHAGKIVWFDVVGTQFVPRFGVQLSLVHDTASQVYRLTDQSGNVTLFDDTTLLFKQRSDSAGNLIEVISYVGTTNLGEVQRAYTDDSGNATVESLLYSYALGGDGINRLSSVLLRRQVNAGPWTNVRQALYTYWDGGNSFGSLGDLKTAEVQSWENGQWNSLGATLYRYWVYPSASSSSSSSGLPGSSSSTAASSSSSAGASGPAPLNHSIKYVVLPDSFARLAADANSGSDPTVAADSVVALYADHYFEYDWGRRVTLETVEGGARSYSYSYTQSGFQFDRNQWAFKTQETLPDGTQNIIYANYLGQVMLSVKAPAAGQGNGPWYDFYAYDASYRVALHAESSAITGYSEAFGDLLNCVVPPPSSSSSSSSASSTPSASSRSSSSLSSHGFPGSSSSHWMFAPLGPAMLSESAPLASSSSSSGSGVPCPCRGTPSCTGNYQYMADYAGLVHLYDYDPTSGYAIRERIRNGECGCDNKLWERVYQAFTAQPSSSSSSASSSSSGGTAASAVYLVTQETQFRDCISIDPSQSYRITTSYAYTFFPGTVQVQSRTTTWPVVATSQNGSGVADSRVDWFDQYGNLAWSKDERGFIQYRAFDIPTGGLVQSIEDVDASQMTGVPAGWSTPGGGGLHLVSDYTLDPQGRTVQTLGPWHEVDIGGVATNVRRATWTVYLDSQFTVYSGQGYATLGSSSSSSSSVGNGLRAVPPYDYVLINPVSITIADSAGRVTDQISAVRTTNPLPPGEGQGEGGWAAGVASQGALSSSDTFPQSSYCRWTTNQYADGTDLSTTRVYFSIPASGIGVEGVNFNQSVFGYDILDRRNRVVSPGGTITRTIFDARNLATAVWVGTNDTDATDSDPTGGGAPGNNMVIVTEYQYDGGLSGGDGNRTGETQHVDSSATRVTAFSFDWRDRQVQVTAAQDWYQVTTLDNLSRVIQVDRYAQATGNLIGRSKTLYDDRGRVCQTVTYGVDPATGDVGAGLVDNNWYDPSGNTIKSLPSGSNAFTKVTYDGAGRTTFQYFGYTPSSSSSSSSSSSPLPPGEGQGEGFNDPTNDIIVEQTETAYDAASNVIQTTLRQRYHNATGVGPLTYPGGAQPVARVSYVAMYPDAVGRQQATANYGTNGSIALVRPATTPARADTVLVGSTVFNNRGEAYQSIDPAGRVDQTTFDDAGRRIAQVQNFVVVSSSSSSSSSSSGALPTSDDKNITTFWTYSRDGQIATLTAVNSATGNQVTTYGYGTSLPSSDIARNDILSSVTYPDGGIVTYLANRQAQTKQFTDQRLVIHAYDFDLLGRQTQDRVISLGSSSSSSSSSSGASSGSGTPLTENYVDSTVQRIGRTYEVRGMLRNVTSYSSPIVAQGSVVNDVQRVYNSFGQLITEYQEHSGAVNTSTSVNVQYQYADGSSNTIRQMALVYPNGRVLSYSYGTSGAIDDALSRIASLIDSDGATHLVDYTRLGTSSFVEQISPEPQIAWSLISGSGINPYTGLDQFNRVVDNRWYSTATNSDLDRIQHGYGRAGNRLWRKNTVTEAAGEYLDELYAYDGIYRLQLMERGQLNGSNNGIVSGTLNFAQGWGLDATGNWQHFWENGSGSGWDLQQSRTANRANEIASTTGAGWMQPKYDNAGNMAQMPQAGNPTTSNQAMYDSWNRLMSISSGGSLTQENRFDGLNRRVMKSSVAGLRHYSYTSNWQGIEERLGSSTTADRQFVWGLRYVDDLTLRDRSGERLYAFQDPNWNSTCVCDSAGIVRERYAYLAYGQPIVFNATFAILPSSGFDWETLFAGYRWDADIGLHQARHRALNSFFGTWLTRDPLAPSTTILLSNLYSYVACRPVATTDPSGLAPKDKGTCKDKAESRDECKFAVYDSKEPYAKATGAWGLPFLCAGISLVGEDNVIDISGGSEAICKHVKAKGCKCASELSIFSHGNQQGRMRFSYNEGFGVKDIQSFCSCLCAGATIRLFTCYGALIDPVDPGIVVEPPKGGAGSKDGSVSAAELILGNCDNVASVEGCTGCYQYPFHRDLLPISSDRLPECIAKNCPKPSKDYNPIPTCQGSLRTYKRRGK